MSGTFWAMLQEESLTATLPREVMDIQPPVNVSGMEIYKRYNR